MDIFFIILGAFAIFFTVSIAVLIVLWIALPFSVFGIKELVRKSIEEQEKTNKLLESVLEAILREKEISEGTDKPQ